MIINNCHTVGWRVLKRWFFTWSILFVIYCAADVTAQEVQQRATRQTAAEAYNKGLYEDALRQFSELLALYPRDPLYKYYCGVCLVKLESEPVRAVKLLKEAAEGSGTIKPVPADVWFWLGRAQQLAGMFSEAVSSYNRFTESAGRKVAREMDVPDYIKQCNEGKGSIAEEVQAAVKKTEQVKISQEKPEGKPPAGGGVERQAAEAEAMYAPVEVDTMLARLLEEKKQMPEIIGKEAGNKDTVIKQKTVTEPGPEVENNKIQAAAKLPAQEVKAPDKKVEVEPVIKNLPAESREPVYSQFEILKKPVYAPDDKVPINPDVPPGLIYRIQIAIFRNPVAPSYFKGLTPVHGFRREESNLTVYYAGMFRKAEDAYVALQKVRGLGFKDAFVVALMDKQQISMERAKVLEKEWGSKPLFEITPIVAEKDTVPPTLVFRVEVMKTPKPLTGQQLEELKKLATGKGFDVLVDDKKNNIYLVGIFINYTTAVEYADLLKRNGYRDARVVAYLGLKEIPVDIARKLFEEY